ncbi:MAG: CBS domain-containing protein [Spongiibacter sp.]|uniref:CBS domain-containing protein n=1 Tax=Spongiibacter thalassae TaxID=2721624 RepID=A0ABX1GAX7_9GAMM|nr:CBS domain-containing protein [Spongiibacter thalassae]MDX1504153.1 CBS domain-containing protein [Spongiibacter sp.]NKI16322.1 CBS domain-containing protein [Spongiibacter thalassae]
MQVQQVMSKNPEYLLANATLEEAAQKMRDLNLGFLPIADDHNKKLQGIVTDRDITVRGVAEGLDPHNTAAAEVKTDKVLYCFENDSLEQAADSMKQAETYRLVVLNNPEEKSFSGIISLADVLRHNRVELSAETARVIVSH